MGLFAGIELRRFVSEWRVKFQRIYEILNPTEWGPNDWKAFACSLAVMAQKHGSSWQHHGHRFSDLRWTVREGGQLVLQVEEAPGESVGVVVGHSGGFAGDQTYIWMWIVLSPEGDFLREPFYVEGTWRDALLALIIPMSGRAGFYLGERAQTPDLPMLGRGEPPAPNSQPPPPPPQSVSQQPAC